MKLFESFLKSKLDEYIIYRHNLGYSDKTLRSLLFTFDQYVKEKEANWHMFQPSYFLEFRQSLKTSPRTVNGTLSGVRGFFHFLMRQDILADNPLQDIPALNEHAFIPFIFSSHETNLLIDHIEQRMRRSPEYFFKDFTIYIIIILLAKCGLRISEPFRMMITHYRSDESTIYIEKTKFSKDRLIAIPRYVAYKIENYMSVRYTLKTGQNNPYLFPNYPPNKISQNQVRKVFHQAVKDIGIDQKKLIIGNTIFAAPTPHSLRHSFAVNTLKNIKDQGKSTQYALAILSIYMGHRKYRYTAVYLKVLDALQRRGLVDFAISTQKRL